MPTTDELTGLVALVTGGSRNIGRRTALALAGRGADVIVTYRERLDAAAEAVAELEALGSRAAALQVDLTGTKQIPQRVAGVKDVLRAWSQPRLDILVNNAGVMRLATSTKLPKPTSTSTSRSIARPSSFLTQQLSDVLADGGRIVNLGSGTARIAFAPLASYGPSKAAVQALTLYLAAHFGPRGITVNAVAPGGLDDDFNRPLFADDARRQKLHHHEHGNWADRWAARCCGSHHLTYVRQRRVSSPAPSSTSTAATTSRGACRCRI